MSKLEIILLCISTISIFFNIAVFAYARAAIVRLLSVSEELGDLQNMINSFSGHLQDVYELDSFYGDQTLHYLLEHAISLNENMATFEHIYTLTEEEPRLEEETDDAEEYQET